MKHIATALTDAHAQLLSRGLECTLDRRARRVIVDAAVEQAREAVLRAAKHAGLSF